MVKPRGPGGKVPFSGIYKNPYTGDKVTLNEGDPFPPTPRPAQGYVPVILTDPKRQPGK